MSISAVVVSSSNQYHYQYQYIITQEIVQHSHMLLPVTTDTMSPLRQNCILKCGIKHSSFACCVNFLKKTQDKKMIFAVKNKICLVCIKPEWTPEQCPPPAPATTPDPTTSSRLESLGSNPDYDTSALSKCHLHFTGVAINSALNKCNSLKSTGVAIRE